MGGSSGVNYGVMLLTRLGNPTPVNLWVAVRVSRCRIMILSFLRIFPVENGLPLFRVLFLCFGASIDSSTCSLAFSVHIVEYM